MKVGIIGAGPAITTSPAGGRWESEMISAGDVVATRVNAAGTDGGRYANRERWRVRHVEPDGGVRLVSLDGTRAAQLSPQAARQPAYGVPDGLVSRAPVAPGALQSGPSPQRHVFLPWR